MPDTPADESARQPDEGEKPSSAPDHFTRYLEALRRRGSTEIFDAVRKGEGTESYSFLLDSLISSSAAALDRTSDTDASLQGTIANLGDRIGRIEVSIASISGTAKTVTADLGIEVTRQIEDQITPVKAELASIKSEVLPELQQAHATMKTLESFLKDNATFLVSAVEAQGLIRGLEGQVHSATKRLDALESSVNKAWDRRLTILSLVIAVISAGVAIYVAVIR